MNLNHLINLKQQTNVTEYRDSKLKLDEKIFNAKFFVLKDTVLYKEMNLISSNLLVKFIEKNTDLVILSEPAEKTISQNELYEFLETYQRTLEKAINQNVKYVHIISNPKWYGLLQAMIEKYNVPVFLTQNSFDLLSPHVNQEKHSIMDNYIYPSEFRFYSNEINKKLIIDLTLYDSERGKYGLNLNNLLKSYNNFDEITLYVNSGSTIPNFASENFKIVYKEFDSEYLVDDSTYVYIHSNKPYSSEHVAQVLFYAANSKVITTNYNYMINNILPSVSLILNKENYIIEPFTDPDAFDILNENRNTVLYNYTLINVLSYIYRTTCNQQLIKKYSLGDSLPNFQGNCFIENGKEINIDIELNKSVFKYDLEKTLLFPIIFLGKSSVYYNGSYGEVSYSKKTDLTIPTYNLPKIKGKEKKLSVIVPVHNNGRYLLFKCFNSLKKLTCFDDLEIILVDDGSTDYETLRIVEDILYKNPEIVYKKLPTGSGSASRPRNIGVELSNTNLITFLDPDNEAIDDGYSILLNEMITDESIDMIVGSIVREDNIKRNEISYFNKVKNILIDNKITDTREALININLSVQSIQALIVKKNIIEDNNLSMVEGAAGQDTLYFQQLMLKCDNVKVFNTMIHSYYAFVEGSVTNTVSHKFFQKFYKVEIERLKFLEQENLIDVYMTRKFNFYFKNWYLKKYSQVSTEEKELSLMYLKKILDLYHDYREYFDEDVKNFSILK